MTDPSQSSAGAEPASAPSGDSSSSLRPPDRQLARWGGIAGIAGVVSLLASVVVVVSMGLPDASDVETLTDFADIETGRILEHFCYLGAVVMFALHALALSRLLTRANPAAALFGGALAMFGYLAMAASAVLHVSTAPLAELYTSPVTPAADLPAIEYAWHGAQSVFDTMLATGLLLAPSGIILLGIAMMDSAEFGRRLGWFAIVAGALGLVGAAVEVVDTALEFSAFSVLVIVLFHLVAGIRTLRLGRQTTAS